MKYLSVCSGIEAATVAWHPLGWTPVGFGEIEKFPCQVLAHHYPDVPNFGDMTRFKEWNFESDVNVLVGGTPCQSFSVAGLRKGLDDPRGNLMLTYLAIAAKHRPRWLVWENVPGVLSSNGGLDFASLLRGMGELGYGFAYRVLDAQYFGVAQRRRRVFVVGYLGNWRPAAAVLFERHSLQGHPAPSREKREGAATLSSSGTGVSRVGFNCEDEWFAETPIALQDVRTVEKMQNGKGWNDDGTAYTVDTHATQGVAQPIPIDTMNHIGRGDKHSFGDFVSGAPSYTLTKHHSHAVAQPLPFDTTQITSPQNGNNPKAGDPCHPLAAGAHPPAIAQAVFSFIQASAQKKSTNSVLEGLCNTLTARAENNNFLGGQAMAVRRLTCMECERLQGFPDGYTDIQPKGKATPDGPRYKALGNSMAVPVMAWIGKRIQEVEGIA